MWPRAVFGLTTHVSMVIGFKDMPGILFKKRNIDVRYMWASALLLIITAVPLA